jgi:pimeloyl-ACP methyl ester carboxylesterase
VSGGVTRPRPAWVPDDLYPFADRYADVAGCVVHHVDEGSGPPLLLLHGNPTWSFLYRKIISGLRDRHRCIAVDYPGSACRAPSRATGSHPPSTRMPWRSWSGGWICAASR